MVFDPELHTRSRYEMVASRNESDSEGEDEFLDVSEIEPEVAEQEKADSRSSSDAGGDKDERLDPDIAPARIHYV